MSRTPVDGNLVDEVRIAHSRLSERTLLDPKMLGSGLDPADRRGAGRAKRAPSEERAP
jgi:hypothetical protein